MTRLLLAASIATLALPQPALAGRYAVGVERGASYERVAAAVEAATGARAERSLAPLRALVVTTRSGRSLRATRGVSYVERLDSRRRLSFAPNDPLAPRQWYLEQVRAFEFWPTLPTLVGPRVAVIDSGVDGSHPDLAGRIARARSFVGGSALRDQQGHGTFVAGLIAAQTNNGVGVAGLAFPSQLLVAKVVANDRMISLAAEADAIRWAADNGARVINLSLGGLRDPRNPSRDTFSELEAAAVRYAHARGAVVVAAVGNADQAPKVPWPYASYPAALPHVVGVGALGRGGSVPPFSNRDPVYVDVAAPGQDLVSTFPRALTAARAGCAEQGYSPCAPDEFRRGEGTSFAAPLVSAAAALLVTVRPSLRPEQVAHLLTRTADDQTPVTGCARCAAGRDALTGWGRLHVSRAVAATVSPPAPDRFETNDDAGLESYRVWGRRGSLEATLDFWNDRNDVYRVYLRKGQRLLATLDGPYRARSALVLWRPGTQHVGGLSREAVAQSRRRGWRQRVTVVARVTGWHHLQAKVVSPRAGPYRLSYSKR